MAELFQHFLIAVLLALLAITNREKIRKYFHTREDDAYIGIDLAIGNATPNFTKVAVGSGSMSKQLPSKDHEVIDNFQQLAECFAHHFSKCAAAERFIVSKDIYDQIVRVSSSFENSTYSVGGNAALMGLKMLYTSPNSSVLLGGPVGPRLADLLDPRIHVPRSVREADDQYHIILEYRDGDTWGNTVSKCSNRFILTSDEPNSKMKSIENFFHSLIDYKPDLVVISGLHLLESQSHSFRIERLRDLADRLKNIQADTPIHLELASMVNKDLMRLIVDMIFPLVDSIGLNEQELAFLTVALAGPHKTDGDLRQWPPEIAVMADILFWTIVKFGRHSEDYPSSRLSRIHFHSLTYHIIAVRPTNWRQNVAAAAAGSSAATRQACDHEHGINLEEVELRTPKYFARSVNSMPLRRNLVKHDQANPVTSWSRDDVEFHFSAVLVCKNPKRTVGLGDCISATGLQYSKFNCAET
eukprot:gene18131-19941_t